MTENWKAALEEGGWVELRCAAEGGLADSLFGLSQMLGVPVGGRNGGVLETLRPKHSNDAHPQSLSKRYSLESLPLHSDTAHWSIPCRYILLGCVEPGETISPTVLLDTKNLNLSENESFYLYNASFFIQNGKKSFYSSIRSKSRPFFRFDPGCMIPVSSDSELAISALTQERRREQLIEIEWKKDKILIIDNWRMLHGRGNKELADQRRELLRIMVQ